MVAVVKFHLTPTKDLASSNNRRRERSTAERPPTNISYFNLLFKPLRSLRFSAFLFSKMQETFHCGSSSLLAFLLWIRKYSHWIVRRSNRCREQLRRSISINVKSCVSTLLCRVKCNFAFTSEAAQSRTFRDLLLIIDARLSRVSKLIEEKFSLPPPPSS
jgi:hypothetical protein